MKRLLRSIMDVDGSIHQEMLLQNYTKLRDSHIDWETSEDTAIFKFIEGYFQQWLEMPSFTTVNDYFEASKDTEIVERLKVVHSAQAHVRTNFTHLLSGILEAQAQIKTASLLKKTIDIVTKGIVIQEKGEDKVRLHGVRDGLAYFSQNAIELISPIGSVKQRGDIRLDGQEVWNEYLTAKINKDKVWGKFTGLNEIDKVCHGLKKGELHIHTAYAGELKCLPGDATIFDHRLGQRRTIEEVYESGSLPVVTSLDREGKHFCLVTAKASHVVQNGVRDVFDLTLTSGRCVGGTDNHLFFTPSGWKSLISLRPGEFVAVPRRMTVLSTTKHWTDAEVKSIGYLIGDGSTIDSLSFTASNQIIRDDFVRCLREMGYLEGPADYVTPTFRVLLDGEKAPSVRISQSRGMGNSSMTSPLMLLVESLGFRASKKRIPDGFFGIPDTQVALLLGALWSTDGSCHTKDHVRKDRKSACKRNDISYGSTSEGLCQDIQSLLLRLGIQSSVTRVVTTYKGKPYTFWTLRVVGNDSKRTFTRTIRVVGKESFFDGLAKRLPKKSGRRIPSSFLPTGLKCQVHGKGYHRHTNSIRRRPTVTLEEASRFLGSADGKLIEAIKGDLDWEEVKAVTFRGREMTYDLSVPEHHSFVVNDIISHNTTMATNWAYNLVTRFRTNVFYGAFEMKREHIRRLIYVLHSANNRWPGLGYHTPLDYRKVRDGELSPEEEKFYQLVIDDFCNNPNYCEFHLWEPDHDINIDEVRQETELLHRQTELGFVVLDHGGNMEARKKKRNKDYVIELNSVIRDTKKFALHFNFGEGIPVLLLFQINRQGKLEAEKNDGVYRMNAIAYANEAERSADVITTTYLDDKLRSAGETKICNLKNRDNPLFAPFNAEVDFSCRRMRNLETDSGNGMSCDDAARATVYNL